MSKFKSRGWLLDVPIWLLLATVLTIFIVGFSRAEAANLINYDFSIKQVGIGPGVCSPGPTCTEPYGWKIYTNNPSWYTSVDRPYGRVGITSLTGGYVALGYRYLYPVTKLSNTLRINGGCSAVGGYFYVSYYNANRVVTGGAKVLLMPKLATGQWPYAMPLILSPFTAPVGTKYVVPYLFVPMVGVCTFDNIFIY